jgi:hypothetical protein
MRLKTAAVSRLSCWLFCFVLFGLNAAAGAEESFKAATSSIRAEGIGIAAESVISNGEPYNTSLGPRGYANAYIDVPAGATSLVITVSEGSGDLDLYVKYGSPFEGSTVAELDAQTDFISDGPTASEQVVVTTSDDPPLKQGKWYVAVLNYNSTTTTFTVTASYQIELSGLESGVPLDYSLGAGRFLQNLYIDVPAEAQRLTIFLADGRGDLHLYVKYGADVTGSSQAELREDADFFSNTPGSDEVVEVSSYTSPQLTSGRWYVAVGNPNAADVGLTVTATYETASEAVLHQLTVGATPQVIVPGDPLDWTYSVTPGTVEGRVDLAAAIMPPWGALMFLTENGLSYDPGVLRWGLDAEDLKSGFLFSELPFPSSVPEGQYGFYAVLVREGNPVPDAGNWVSNVGGALVRFHYRSPDHDWFLTHEGFPDGFVKSFSQRNGLVRADETWTYAGNGLLVSFVNGNFAGDAPVSEPAVGGTPTPFRAEDYRFDTTRQDLTNRLGPPPAKGDYSVWDGNLEVLVYDGIVFGLHNDRLTAVTAGPSVSGTPSSGDPSESVSGETKSLSRPNRQEAVSGRGVGEDILRSFSADFHPQSLPATDEAYLFSLASTLAASALSGVPGAEDAWNTCLAGFATQEPSEADLQCLRTALSGLVNAAAPARVDADWKGAENGTRSGALRADSRNFTPAGGLDWLSSVWNGLFGHETTTGKPAGHHATRDGKTGCVGSVSPVSVEPGSAANFRMDLYSRLRQQVGAAPIRGTAPSWDAYWEDRMSFIGEGDNLHWEYAKIAPQGESPGGKEALMYATPFASSGAADPALEPVDLGDLCTAAALFYLKTDAPTVTLTSDAAAVRVNSAGAFKACIHGGAPPFTLSWDLAGASLTKVVGVEDIRYLGEFCRTADRVFTETGTYTVGVSLTDADGGYDYASVDILVTAPELRLKFLQTTSETYVGLGGAWSADASGGVAPYTYAYAFSDGVSGSADSFFRLFNTPGTRTVTVTAADSGNPPQTASVSSSIWVRACEPPDCCPDNPVPCGALCAPSGATCCNQATGEWCMGPDCCPKPCVPPDCCTDYPQVCGSLCIPGGAHCCNPGAGSWCLSTEECCGGGCCEPDWYCCPDQAGCCRDGDVCCTGGGCCPAVAPKCCFPGCCPEKDECCGSGCCPPGYFCCPDKTGCCPDGYQCIEGGKCAPITGGTASRRFSGNQFPKTNTGCQGAME